MVKNLTITLSLVAVLLFAACAPQPAAPTAAPPPAPSPLQTAAPMVAEAIPAPWGDWDRVVEAAKHEGRVVVYGTTGGEVRAALIRGFHEKYGIPVEFVSGRGAEISQKLFTERQAGIYVADIYIGGATTIVTQLKPVGALDPLESQLVLPEVLDPQVWWGGLRFVDADRRALAMSAYPSVPIAYNTSQVKPEELKSYRDLLNPKWKGRIILNDPTVAGAGSRWFGIAAWKIVGVDYMRELAKQEPVILRDERLMVDWVARGKYPIVIMPKPEMVAEFKKAGAPIKDLTPVEGTFVTAGSACLGLLNKAPHPKAAKVFINWILTREGQTVLNQAFATHSGRLDVPTDFLDPIKVRDPAGKYFVSDDEEFLLRQPEWVALAKEIFGHLLK